MYDKEIYINYKIFSDIINISFLSRRWMRQRQQNVQRWGRILSRMRLPMRVQRQQRKRLQSTVQCSLRENRLKNRRPPVL